MEDESKKVKIIDAALKLFSSKGYHKTKMIEIADEAGVAKGTLYWYFDSKKQLFQAILLNGISQLVNRMKEDILEEEGARDKLRKVIELSIRFFAECKQLSKMYQESTVAISQDFKEKLFEIKEEEVRLILKIIDEGKEEGVFRVDLDSSDLSNILIGMIGSFNPHFHTTDEEDLLTKIDLILDVFLNGISS
ncbi:TetR/AcrR family transcriptional regulator [Halonatronum saccharophilum]|uniref:TetR/AcrR family transcriptional regulator n=2 Tax=Halonatronum saccharophilum TaxID=150060 RepID=UPI0004AD8802|nr:TetR/AcrR family transcriptional regulator [Halonatronum saccharophilum]